MSERNRLPTRAELKTYFTDNKAQFAPYDGLTLAILDDLLKKHERDFLGMSRTALAAMTFRANLHLLFEMNIQSSVLDQFYVERGFKRPDNLMYFLHIGRKNWTSERDLFAFIAKIRRLRIQVGLEAKESDEIEFEIEAFPENRKETGGPAEIKQPRLPRIKLVPAEKVAVATENTDGAHYPGTRQKVERAHVSDPYAAGKGYIAKA